MPIEREFSAGGVVVRNMRGMAYIVAVRVKNGTVLALPKGHIDPGESPEQAAAREVREETGIEGTLVEKIDDIRYWYSRAGTRVLKVVSFFLLRYRSGRLGDIPPEHAHEVAEVRWLPLEEAPKLLAYKGEREMALKALERISR